MITKGIAAIAFVSAMIGAGGAFWWQALRTGPVNRTTHSPHSVREEFVPFQELSLTDSAGTPLGSIDASDGLAVLHLYAGGGLFIAGYIYGDGRVSVSCFANGGETSVTLTEDGVTAFDLTLGGISMPWMYSSTRHTSLLDRLRGTLVASPKTSKKFDDPEIIPSEDVRFRNRRGWVFASMGFTASASPGIAFADASGAVRLTWFQHKARAETLAEWIAANRKSGDTDGAMLDALLKQGGVLANQIKDSKSKGYSASAIVDYLSANMSEPDLWEVIVRDKEGRMRLTLELREGEPPDMVLLPDDWGTQYVLDFGSKKLVPKGDVHLSALTWLPSMKNRPLGRIEVTDNRGRKLWRSP